MSGQRPLPTSPMNADEAPPLMSCTSKWLGTVNGISSTVEDKNNDFMCPICFDLIREAHITKCGHTFCYQCITKSIQCYKQCPKCNAALTSLEMVFPNYLLDELISKHNIKLQLQGDPHSNNCVSNADGLKSFLSLELQKLSLPDLNIMLDMLTQHKQLLEAESCAAQNRLLYEFLKHLLDQKKVQLSQIMNEIVIVKKDLQSVEDILRNVSSEVDVSIDMGSSFDEKVIEKPIDKAMASTSAMAGAGKNDTTGIFGSLVGDNGDMPSKTNFLTRKRRMYSHFDDFVASYFSTRTKELYLGSGPDGENHADGVDESTKSNWAKQGLDLFRENLIKFSRYNTLRPLATIHYSSDLHISSTIVSTIVFDKDNEYFAIGGVTKRIKVYDYMAVVRDDVDIHYPVVEMVSTSKISCIAWNSYHKSILASSDYEGAVNIWDATTSQRTRCLHEHEKRCWSVDFNDVDTRLIVSGSDDARVKLWSLKEEHSIATLEARANVCCVKFNPKSSCHLAFGSADHDVHYYDLRNMRKALCIFKGHKKAVSYVKFLNTHEIISASTDSQLKLWNVNSPQCLRSFTGHINEKNFVGLATDGDYIACGSEDNSLYVYYKGLSKQLFSYRIDVGQRVSDMEKIKDLNEFVSAVCWRKQCNVVLAANSRGLIKVLELV